MNQSDIEKAFELLSRHNDALMLQVAEYEKQTRTRKIRKLVWATIKARFRAAIGRE